ncbi:fatty acid desaturase-domain-containing protein [Amylostereum chailletii]|nr:fatty acid desaturase-domain-containing protein [Amylostereum chailletii]
MKEFTPLAWSMGEIRATIPSHLFVRHTRRALSYLGRDLAIILVFWWLATWIDSLEMERLSTSYSISSSGLSILRYALWAVYWWFQGLAFTGLWVIGHECGHGAFSSSRWVCNVVGFSVHTALWTPYFSWRISHHRHHQNHASMERDEVYVPKTRSDLGLPKEAHDDKVVDYDEILGDTPLYTIFMLVRQQLLAFPAYLLLNVSGQKGYPKWTNHFDPKSILFTPSQRNAVLVSNVGMAIMLGVVIKASKVYGAANVIKYYGIPWLLVTHWFIMITFLHHTSPEIPHYRAPEWNYQRGAAATVDRDFLGWQGRFFLHDGEKLISYLVAHFHVVHHFFPRMPWYNGAEATAHLKAFLGSQYLYSNKPVFNALWKSYNDCQFVEDEGTILFYRDRNGKSIRRAVTERCK